MQVSLPLSSGALQGCPLFVVARQCSLFGRFLVGATGADLAKLRGAGREDARARGVFLWGSS